MIVFKGTQDRVLSTLQSVAGIVERRHVFNKATNATSITNGFPEQGGSSSADVAAEGCNASGEAPAVAGSDDDGNSEEGDPDRRSKHLTSSTEDRTAHRSLSPLTNIRREGAVNQMTQNPIAAGKTPDKAAESKAVTAIPHLFDLMPDSAYIRIAQLVQSPKNPNAQTPLPFSAPTLWRKVKAGTFPQPVKLGERITAWKVGSVRTWLNEQAAG